MRVADIDTLVLCGGGLLGVAYIGALETLFRTVGFDFFSHKRFVRNFVGVSVGSVLSLVLSLGLKSAEELRTVYYPLIFGEEGMATVMEPNPVTFVKSWGADDGSTVRRILETILQRRGLSSAVSFRELHRRTGARLTVCVTNVTRGATEYMSAARTPDLRVVDAIMMSTALPPLFAPVRHPESGDLYVDGCLLRSLPVACERASEGGAPGPPVVSVGSTLVLRQENGGPAEVKSLSTYIGRIISMLLTANTAKERAPPDLPTLSIGSTGRTPFNFDFSKQDGSRLLLCGVESAERFLREHAMEPFEPTRTVGVQTDPMPSSIGRRARSKKRADKKLRALALKKKKRDPIAAPQPPT